MNRRTASLLGLLIVSACGSGETPEIKGFVAGSNELSLDSVSFPYEPDVVAPFKHVDEASARDAVPEVPLVIDDDDRELSGTEGYPHRANVALRRTRFAADAYCSGFKITPRHILTAAHCLYWAGAWQSHPDTMRVVLRQDGTDTGTKVQPIKFWVPPAWLESTPLDDETPNWGFDYALITLPDAANTPGWFDFRAQPDFPHDYTPIVSGYPLASTRCTQGPDGRCGGWLYSAQASFDAVYANMFVTRADWESGQSGGPVYYLPAGETQYRAIGIISNDRSPAAGTPFLVGTHGNRALRITSSIEAALCERINDERPSTVPSHHCYR